MAETFRRFDFYRYLGAAGFRVALLLFLLVPLAGHGGVVLPSPQDFRAELSSHTAVRLVWSYVGEPADFFVVERKVDGGSFTQVAQVPGSENSYVQTGLSAGTTYTYRVRTRRGSVYSAYGREGRVTVPVQKDFIPPGVTLGREPVLPVAPVEQVLPWSTLAPGNTYDVFQTPPCLEGEYYVGFELVYDLGDFNTGPEWTADLELVFLEGNSVLWTKPLSLRSATATWTGTVFHDVALECHSDYRFRIQSRTGTGSVPAARLVLKEKLFRKTGDTFSAADVPVLSLSYSGSTRRSTLSWTYPNDEFREFDLEWVFISSYDNLTGTTAVQAFSRRDGVRVRLNASSYEHPIYYPAGRVFYRIRAVGYHPDFPDRKLLGNWAYGPVSGTAASNAQVGYNWQVRTDFIEGGRFRKSVSYLDGTLRQRQHISTLNGSRETLVSETWYDFEGRESLQFLPTPVLSTSMNFRVNFNRFSNPSGSEIFQEVTSDFRRKKYQYDNGPVANNTGSTAGGAARYYSASNTFTGPNIKYTPSAGGYAMTAVEYADDPTGRVRKQGQTGSRFRIDGENTTRKFYGQAFPEDLIRLFGVDVGEAGHYRKEAVVDPNGQAAVQYINQEGQVIATALAGGMPANVAPLAEYEVRASAGWPEVVYDLAAHNRVSGSGSLVDASFINTTANTPHSFSYTLYGIGSELDQIGCRDCVFSLGLWLEDPDGTRVGLPAMAGDESPEPWLFSRTFTAVDCQVEEAFPGVSFAVTLDKVGEYRVVKELRVREPSFSEILAQVHSSTEFLQQKEAVEVATGLEVDDCVLCMEECAEADAAIVEAMGSMAEQEITNIRERITQEVLAADPQLDPLDAAAVGAAVAAHGDYCHVLLLEKNRPARITELESVQVSDWSGAVAGGWVPLADRDPFYRAGQSGAGHRAALDARLANIQLGGGLSGSLAAVTDPYNPSMRVDGNGSISPSGYHLLYYDLFAAQAELDPAEFQAQLGQRRWALYRSFYTEASRLVKNGIPEIQGCASYLAAVNEGSDLPRTEEGIRAFLETENLMDEPVSDEELDQVLAMVQSHCPAEYTPAELSVIAGSLENYLNTNRMGNPFNLVMEEDLGSPALAPLSNLLQSKGCTLADIAVPNPIICVRDSVIRVSGEPVNGGFLPNCSWMQTSAPMAFSTQSSGEIAIDSEMTEEEEAMDLYWESLWTQHQEELLADLGMQSGMAKSGGGMGIMSNALPSQAEYDALMDLYQATNGANWVHNSGWSTANPNVVESVRYWSNILTDSDGHVTHLMLNFNGLNGQLPSSLQNLVHLKYLQVGGNNLQGPIPTWLNALTELTHLSLTESRFTGTIPAEIGQLTKLEELALHRNNLVGTIPSSFTNLTELRWLLFYDNNLTGGIPADIGNLTKLEYLYMYRNFFSGPIPESITNISTLKFLGLHTNFFSGELPAGLGNLSNLTTLLLHYNNFSGNLSPTLGNLTNMESFWIYSNRFSGTLPSSMGNYNKTHTFYAHNNLLEGTIPESFGNMASMVYLRLDHNKLTGQIPSSLGNLSSLIELRLSSNNLSGSIPPSFCNLSHINLLVLNNNNLEGALPPCLFDRNMTEYWISMNYYSCEDLENSAPHFYSTWNYWPQRSRPQYEEITVCVEYELDPSANPWLGSVTYVPDWEDILERCESEKEELREALRGEAVEVLENSWVEQIYRESSGSCLEDSREVFTVTATVQEYHYTLYYYDQSGNLVQTVPPAGVNPLDNAQVAQVKEGGIVRPDHGLPTRYRYNSKDQLVWQSTPDDGESRFWYNAVGQLRLSQNAVQAGSAIPAYSYSRYDRLGRVVETGELETGEAVDSLLVKLRNIGFPQREEYTCHDITLTGYDLPKTGLSGVFPQQHLRNRVSWTAQLEKGKADTLLTAYSYDPHGNVSSLLQRIPGMEAKVTTYRYDQISGNVNYVWYQPGTAEQLAHRYSYDADNRIEYVQTSTDGYVWTTDATYYYYPHGPLARVELGEHKVQGLDYYYTLQGWLKGVNMPGGGDPGGDGLSQRTGKDAMAFALGYFNGDYTPIGSGIVRTDTRDALWTRNNAVSGNTGLYNGNISWMNTELAGSVDQYDMQAMLYKYDQLHRIVQARSLREYTTNFTSRTATSARAYDADYSYDGNGNLLTLKRRDSGASLLHDYAYEYYPGTNRLRKVAGEYSPIVPEQKVYDSNPLVSDGQQYRRITVADGAVLPSGSSADLRATDRIVFQPGSHIRSGSNLRAVIEEAPSVPIPAEGQYGYDAVGNLVSDAGEGITEIEWTPSGKVRRVSKATGDPLEFRYDASGNRVEKKQGANVTRYVRDASGNVMAVYQNGTLVERPVYGSSRLGQVDSASAPGYRTLGLKRYELSNHLGNVLTVVSDRIHMRTDSTWAEVISRSDYYPFGLAMGGRTESSGYRYGFNGKEQDSPGMGGGGNTYDYGFRIYNPEIGKFLSVDPLAADYPWYTPFQYAGNSPIANIDVDGLEDQLAIDGSVVTGPINMEKYNNSILQKMVDSERQVMGLKPFSRREDSSQSFIGPNNHPLSYDDSRRLIRKYEAESNLIRLKEYMSQASPFVGGGTTDNPFGFASTFVTASKEVPSIFLQEYLGAQLFKTFAKPVKTFSEFRSETIGVFKNTNGVHHTTLRSQGYQLYRSNIFQFNNNLERATQLTGDFLDVKGILDKISLGIEDRLYKTTSPEIPDNEMMKDNE